MFLLANQLIPQLDFRWILARQRKRYSGTFDSIVIRQLGCRFHFFQRRDFYVTGRQGDSYFGRLVIECIDLNFRRKFVLPIGIIDKHQLIPRRFRHFHLCVINGFAFGILRKLDG